MDQLRHLMYNPPAKPNPWDPTRWRPNGATAALPTTTPLPGSIPAPFPSGTGDIPPSASKSLSTDSKSSIGSKSSNDSGSSLPSSPSRRDLAHELEVVLNRGHPNIVKLLDFFEDREFYYRTYTYL